MNNADYEYIIPDNPYRHALDENHSPYMGYDMTVCGEIVKEPDTYDSDIPICPKCADYYSTANQIKRLERKLTEAKAQIKRLERDASAIEQQIKTLSTL